MTRDLRRLLDGPDGRVAATLRAGLRDAPSSRSVLRAAQSLGLGSAAALTVARSAAAGHAASNAGSASSFVVAVGKWFALGLVVGGVTTSSFNGHILGAESAARSIAQAHSSAAHSSAKVQAPTALRTPVPLPAEANDAPAAPLARARSRQRSALPAATPLAIAASAPAVTGTPAPRSGSLDSEVTFLNAARRALRSGESSAALAMLDERERTLSTHALDAEARLLRVQALVGAGRFAEARAIAARALVNGSHEEYACRLAKLAGLVAAGCPRL